MKWSRCVIVLIVGEVLRIKANGVQLTDIAFKENDFAFKFFKRSYKKGKQARFRQVTVELSNVCQVDLKQNWFNTVSNALALEWPFAQSVGLKLENSAAFVWGMKHFKELLFVNYIDNAMKYSKGIVTSPIYLHCLSHRYL